MNPKVITAFIISSFLTLALAITSLLFDLSGSKKNAVDNAVTSFIKNSARQPSQRTLRLLRGIFFPVVFSLSDTQLIANLSILIAGWFRYPDDLSVYHFTIIADLAWIGSNTQLIAFFALHKSAQAAKRRESQMDLQQYDYLCSKLIRGSLMSVQFIMLVAVSIIQGHKDWYDSYPCPAICLSSDLHFGGEPKSWMIANLVLLFWAYGSALIPMFSRILNAYKLLKRLLRDIFGPTVSHKFHLIVLSIDSMTFDIIFTSFWWIWGAVTIILDRIYGESLFCLSSNDGLAPTENTWAFGQLVPMFLLLAPFLTMMDAIGKDREGNDPDSYLSLS